MSRLSLRRAHLRAAVLVLLGLLLAMPGWGAEKKSRKKKTSYTVGEMAYKKLLAAQELIGDAPKPHEL